MTDQKSEEIKQGTKLEKKVDLKVEGVMIKKAQQNAIARAATVRLGNVEAFAQQNIRQGRPAMRAEVIFVRKIFGLNTEQLRRINHDAETGAQRGSDEFRGEPAKTTGAHRWAAANRPSHSESRWGQGSRTGIRSRHEETPDTRAIQPI